MTTQEMIFNYLKDEGFVPSYDEDRDIRFKYQMRNFIVSNYENDKQFLQIMMPYIFDVTAENRRAALEACNKINADKKIVKAVVMNDAVFLSTEILLDSTPEPKAFVMRMLDMLLGSQQAFYSILREM
ncbi:YbjN domain-containing protein [uncultured Alistipes sp.]|uniref:YbjN domain-containing protein n=1 Tax=uncultured Alistipes sp. TaxID=538949 RepID=UPI00260C10CE|nr:YbjN domain-containing protein [uncultured Alistipes sp.]